MGASHQRAGHQTRLALDGPRDGRYANTDQDDGSGHNQTKVTGARCLLVPHKRMSNAAVGRSG